MELRAELASAKDNERIGELVLHETPEQRVWLISLPPGQRLPFHCHRRDYLWLSLTDGKAISRRDDGTTHEVHYLKGDCRQISIRTANDVFIHDLTNHGEAVLGFLTVEFFSTLRVKLSQH